MAVVLAHLTAPAGLPTSVAITGTGLQPLSAARKRFSFSDRGYGYTNLELLLRHTDSATPGTDVRKGFQFRRLNADTCLVAWVEKSFLHLDKLVGGTLTTLATSTIVGLASGYEAWLRVRAVGNVITVEHFLGATKPTPMQAGDANVITYTLTGGDITMFGTQAGLAGVYWVPGTSFTGQRLKQWICRPLTYPGLTLPARLDLEPVPGTAPALADLELTTSGGTDPPAYARFSWTPTPATPLSGAVVPFGIIEAETGGDLATWASGVLTGGSGGNGLLVNTSGAGTAVATYVIDPSVIDPVDFDGEQVTLDIQVRANMASTVVSARLAASLINADGTSFGQGRPAPEFGAAGAPLVVPSAGTHFRRYRLGTLTATKEQLASKWKLKLAASWAAGSTGHFDLDRLIVGVAKRTAHAPTRKALDTSYPRFVQSTSETTRLIKTNLRGFTAKPPSDPFPDTPLAGTPLELDPDGSSLLLDIASLVPDDPSAVATDEQLSHAAAVHVSITPRVRVARAA